MPEEIVISIDPFGVGTMIYSDEHRDMLSAGTSSIKRASHVEPDENNLWWSDMSPIGGPRLGPFVDRQEALDNEVAWIKQHHLGHDPNENEQNS